MTLPQQVQAFHERAHNYFGHNPQSKSAESVMAHHITAFISTTELNLTTVQTGKLLGLHHSTIIHARDKVRHNLKHYQKYIDKIKEMT